MTTARPKRAILANLGQPPNPDEPQYRRDQAAWMRALADWLNTVAGELERYSQVNDAPTANPYTLSNVTPTRTFDADSTTLDEVADVVGTLIADLQSKGITK